MNIIILVQPTESSSWEILDGFYSSFQDAREMVQTIRGNYGKDVSFAIEHADDVLRKNYILA